MKRVTVLAITLCLGFFACAGQQPVHVEETNTADLREEIEALKRAVDASYERARAMGERLRVAEEGNSQLQRELQQQQGRIGSLAGRLDTMVAVGAGGAAPRSTGPVVFTASQFDAPHKYRIARDSYTNRQYDKALGQLAEILTMAPYSNLADNSQYWIGECYYGLGKFRQALTEFTKVFAYPKTEKSDDAQLKIARCYLALGEKDNALLAFQKLLDEYPESEYLDEARKEMTYLKGPR